MIRWIDDIVMITSKNLGRGKIDKSVIIIIIYFYSIYFIFILIIKLFSFSSSCYTLQAFTLEYGYNNYNINF